MLQFCTDLCQGKDDEFARIPINGVANLHCKIGCWFVKFRHRPTPTEVFETPNNKSTPSSQTPTPTSYDQSSCPTLPTLRLADFPIEVVSPNPSVAEFPMDVASAIEIRRISEKLPIPTPITKQPLDRSMLRGLDVGAWHLWKVPSDGLFYPGRIQAIDNLQCTFTYQIPSELMYKPDGVVSDHIVVETFDFYIKTKVLSDTDVYALQVIRLRVSDLIAC